MYPPAADAFSACTMLCAYSAACMGITRRTEPAIAPIPSVLRTSRREIDLVMRSLRSQISFLRLIKQVIRSSPRQRHNRERRIFVRIGHKGRGIGNEQILHIVRLAIFVQYRSLRIHSHSRGAEFMNDHAAIGDSVGPWRVRACLRGINSARGLNNGAK